MNHDAIAGAAGSHERMAISAEAERVSRRAAEALAASRMERARVDVSVPTWCVARRFDSILSLRLTR